MSPRIGLAHFVLIKRKEIMNGLGFNWVSNVVKFFVRFCRILLGSCLS